MARPVNRIKIQANDGPWGMPRIPEDERFWGFEDDDHEYGPCHLRDLLGRPLRKGARLRGHHVNVTPKEKAK